MSLNQDEDVPLMAHDERTVEDDDVIKPLENEKARNLAAFFLLGLSATFPVNYVLSAAFDILGGKQDTPKSGFYCHKAPVAIVVITGMLPAVVVKVSCPWFMQAMSYHVRYTLIILSYITGILLLSLSSNIPVAFVGIVIGAASAAFCEITALSLSAHFHKDTVSAFSSGSALAGITAAFIYAGITSLGVAPRPANLMIFICPLLIIISFWLLLELPRNLHVMTGSTTISGLTPSDNKITFIKNAGQDRSGSLTLKEKFKLLSPLMKYLIPLFLVYLLTYLTNQSLFELLYYDLSWLNQAAQYRWFQFSFQVGEFISRSSVKCIRIRKLFYMAGIDVLIFILILMDVIYRYIPSVWITFVVLLIEGLCSGAVYVNAMYSVNEEVTKDYREFSMGAASIGDVMGIFFASLLSLPIHSELCRIKLKSVN